MARTERTDQLPNWWNHMTRCLAIDDSKIIRKLEVRRLNILSTEACEAENGVKGLDVCTLGLDRYSPISALNGNRVG
jgi:hypothetical protein